MQQLVGPDCALAQIQEVDFPELRKPRHDLRPGRVVRLLLHVPALLCVAVPEQNSQAHPGFVCSRGCAPKRRLRLRAGFSPISGSTQR
jgi:hypothetical protein